MADKYLTFVIDGSGERNGFIPADAFIGKLELFIATIYGFERAFAQKTKRQIDLEIVDLSRNSPAQVKLRPRAKTVGYPAQEALRWTVEQLGRIHDGKGIDARVPQQVIDNVVQLAEFRKTVLPELALLKVILGDQHVSFDETMRTRALAIRTKMEEQTHSVPWYAGISYGSVFGELRGLMDVAGERQFFIIPPSGADRIQCVFPEAMRPLMVEYMFKTVTVHGFLHYNGSVPFPYLMEANKLDGYKESDPVPHFSDLFGLFKGLEDDAGDQFIDKLDPQ